MLAIMTSLFSGDEGYCISNIWITPSFTPCCCQATALLTIANVLVSLIMKVRTISFTTCQWRKKRSTSNVACIFSTSFRRRRMSSQKTPFIFRYAAPQRVFSRRQRGGVDSRSSIRLSFAARSISSLTFH